MDHSNIDSRRVLNLELTVEETNIVISAIGRLPLSEVLLLFSKIREQADAQLRKLSPATADTRPL